MSSGHAEENDRSLSCREKVAQFLSEPNETTLSAIDGEACWPELSSANSNLNRLLGFVKKGNPWGAKYLTRHLNKLDGGNLEDSLIALGQFSDYQAVLLLRFAKNGDLSDQQLADALTMLPLSMSDDPYAQLKVMRQRRVCIANVNNKDLANERAAALKNIDSFIAKIEMHK